MSRRTKRWSDAEDQAVAVRSSATAEDLADASFAGQQETYLNVRGPEDLLAAVRDCWASLWTERALTYRARQEIDPSSVALAVVVQQMVDAESAGVMFTANPANGRRDQLVISAAWGLGEAVVSGAVDTDNLVVEANRTSPGTRRRSRSWSATPTIGPRSARCPLTGAQRRCSTRTRPSNSPHWVGR